MLPVFHCAGQEHMEGLGKPSHRWWPGQHLLPLKPTIRSVAAAQERIHQWCASSLSTPAHVWQCGKLCRTARACERFFTTITSLNIQGGSECMVFFLCSNLGVQCFESFLVHFGKVKRVPNPGKLGKWCDFLSRLVRVKMFRHCRDRCCWKSLRISITQCCAAHQKHPQQI